MPIVATPTFNTSAPVISRDDIRMFLRDYSQNNILLDDVQFTDRELDSAMSFAVDEWNQINPISADTSASIPKSILILGTCAWLMMSESFLQVRNQATYQDGEVAPIGIDDKHQLYFQLSRNLKEEWKTRAQLVKTQKNMESGYGGLSSGYRNVGRFNHS